MTTWVASAFVLALGATALAGRGSDALMFAINPAMIASAGWIMLWRDRPSVATQLLVGMIALGLTVGILGPDLAQAPIIGFLAMGVAGALFVRHQLKLFVLATGVGMALVAVAQAGDAPGAEVMQLAIEATGGYIFLVWLVLWMKGHWIEGQEQLQNLIRSKDQLVASVSHELRTPMTSVVGLARELDDRFDDFEYSEVRELLGLMVHESSDVADILEDLLVAARAEVGTLSLDLQPVDIYGEINWALSTVPGATIERHDDSAAIYATADAGRVRQILRNLAVNARRYGGPAVRVLVEKKPHFVTIAVRDNGQPIAVPDRARIFEPYQGVIGSRHVPGSVGLGLTVSRQLARLMGGDLSYEHDGSETAFVLTLPIADAPRRARVAEPVAEAT